MSESTLIRDPAQLPLDLRPGTRDRGQPKLVWQRWTRDEQIAIEMDERIGSYSTGRMVEVAR